MSYPDEFQKALERKWRAIARKSTFQKFYDEFIVSMVLPYPKSPEVWQDFSEGLGLKRNAEIDKIYKALL